MDATDQSGVEPDEDSQPNGESEGVTIRVLGPLRVIAGTTELDPGPRRSRTVLALLVSELGRVVTTDQLIDGIWGDDPPPTAKKAVHVHISNIRRSLGEDFPLRTAPGGYVLQAAGVDVDAAEFQDRTDRGTRLLRTDPSVASRLLAEALGLWNGPAYADLGDEAALVPEITRLTELRLRAVEHRIDADLRLGRHVEVVGELEALAVDHPYRERFRELHMLALYRSGRQAEALRAYEHTRAVLSDELGLDPSPALRELQHQILEQAGSLDLDETGAERYAFLATDLEDSTAMWDTETESMQEALATHDRVIARAVERRSGRVFKSTGDGVLAVFAYFGDAANAAAAAQLELADVDWPTKHPLRVRMAVDEGPAARRDDDYLGPAMNRVNRIMSSGHGGQVLMPSSLAAASPISTRPLGAVDYRGLGRIDVSQMDIAGMPTEFPELRTERTPAPLERDGFGRSIRGYELRERLGEGAHGFVYRAYQASIGREVAVKVIRPEFANRAEFVKRFEAEARFIAQLEHPHIVSLYDYWRDLDGAYLAMRLLRGGSLASSLERAPWRPPAALHLLDQVGTALDYAHRHGIVHRDLKPANVLLDDEGNAYLTDFGIATQHVQAVGLPVESSAAYVSPEELAGDSIGTPADVYGLALLTYEILTGDRPALGSQPRPIAETRHDLPAALDPVLAQSTDPDPDRRPARVDDFLRALRQAFGADVIRSRRSVQAADVRNPFKGLRAFAETDSRDFFGRESLIDDVIAHVMTHGLTAVVGPSGCGKSSLVRAGLLPAVRRGALDTGGDVLITEMFPGSFPFEELEAALMRVAVRNEGALVSDLLADDRGLLRASKQILPTDDSQLLLVIDQFEELFSLTTDERVRRQFLANLSTAVGDCRGRIRVVATIRADFLDRPLAEADFGALMGSALVPVAMPTRDELAQAIARPAAAAGLDLEAGLVPRIVGDVVDQPGALPMLQHALTELVSQRTDSCLTLAAYERTGGVDGAVAARAEAIYHDLPEPSRQVARQLFLRLVSVDDDTDDTRRRVRRSELDSLGLNASALDNVLDEFGSFRLLSFDHDPITRGPTVEVAHEALIREWPRYREWVDERREDLLLERRLDVATGEWEANDRDPGFLFTSGRLEQYEQWAESIDTRLTESERAFLDAGRATDDEAFARLRARRRGVLASVSALSVLAMVLAMVAVVQRGDAEEQASRAEEQAALADEQAARAAGEAGRAAAAADRAAAESDRALDAESDAEAARDAEADARMLSEARLLATRAAEVFAEDQDAGLLLAVAASDLLDASGQEAPEVMAALFDTATRHRALHRFELPRELFPGFGAAPLPNVSSDPEGNRLAVLVASPDGDGVEVQVLDLRTGALLSRLDAVTDPTSVRWDPVTGDILIGSDGMLSSIDPETGRRDDLIEDVPGSVFVLSADADAITFVHRRAGLDEQNDSSTSVIVDRTTGEALASYPDTFWVARSPSGDRIVVSPTGRLDTDEATLESFPAGDPLATTASNNVFGWTPDGDLVVEFDGALDRVAPDGTVIATTRSPTVPVIAGLASAALSPDGRWIAIEGAAGRVYIHDAATLELVDGLTLDDGGSELLRIAWAGDSRHLITVDNTDQAVVWDLSESDRGSQVAMTGSDRSPFFTSDPTDTELLLGWTDGGWEWWNTETGVLERRATGSVDLARVVVRNDLDMVATSAGYGQGVEVVDLRAGTTSIVAAGEFDMPLALSPDGSLLAVARLGRTLLGSAPEYALLDTASGEKVFGGEYADQNLFNATFSPEGRVLLVPTWNPHGESRVAGGVTAVDTVTGVELATLATDGGAFAVTYSPDGRVIAVGGGRGGVELHRVDDFLAGRDSLIGRAAIPRSALMAPSFDDDGVMVIAGEAAGSFVTAWSADAAMDELWSVEVDGPSSASTRIIDGLLWVPATGALPVDPYDGATGLIGVPAERARLADFARQQVTRGFTEGECRTYFQATCAQLEQRLGR